MTTQTILHLFAFLLIINSAFGLECYKCESKDTPECIAHPNLTRIVDCFDEARRQQNRPAQWLNVLEMQCAKIVGKSPDGQQVVGRGCMPKLEGLCDTASKTLQQVSQNTITDVKCHVCDGDKCNTAAKYGVYASLLGVVTATVTLLL